MRLTKTLPLAAAGLLALPAAAMAKDRNHDGLPDGWERAHHLSLAVNQAHRDQDHDGLDNRAEFRHHSNPRSANTRFAAASGTQDTAGTVTSFQNGVLTITLGDGSTLKGAVTSATEVNCDNQAADNENDDQGEDQGSNQGGDRARIASDGGDQGDDDAGENQASGTCAIAQGDQVREADLRATSGGPVFEEVKLAK